MILWILSTYSEFSLFRGLEFHEIAKCTNPYELQGQIGVSGARNHFFHDIPLFRWNFTFRRKTICARKSSSERKTGIRRRGHMRKSWFRLTICALNCNQNKESWNFHPFHIKLVQMGGILHFLGNFHWFSSK